MDKQPLKDAIYRHFRGGLHLLGVHWWWPHLQGRLVCYFCDLTRAA